MSASAPSAIPSSAGRTRTAAAGARPRVLVVGAGSAGLAAAWRLERGGCDVRLVERGGRAGGRAAGERADGFWIDRSLPLLSTADRHLIRFIGELGLRDACLPLRPVELAQAGPAGVSVIDPGRVGGIARIPGVRTLDALRVHRLPRLLRRYGSALDSEHPERAARWDDRSLGDFARLYFGRSACECWAAPAVRAMYTDDPDELSRVAFLLHQLEAGRGLPGVPRAGLGEIAGQAARSLDVALGTEVQALESGPDGGFRAVLARPDGEAAVEADAVVVATDAPRALALTAPFVAAAERDFLAGVETLPSATFALALERPVSTRPRLVRVPRARASSLAAILLEPGGRDGRAPEGCGLLSAAVDGGFARAHQGASEDVVEKTLLEEIERILPGVRGRVRFARLERTRDGTPRFAVGSYRRLERFRRVGRELRARGRRLYFAGDWLAGPRLEHALASAERAARAALADLGRAAG